MGNGAESERSLIRPGDSRLEFGHFPFSFLIRGPGGCTTVCAPDSLQATRIAGKTDDVTSWIRSLQIFASHVPVPPFQKIMSRLDGDFNARDRAATPIPTSHILYV